MPDSVRHLHTAEETISKELALELCMDARKDAAKAAREDVLALLEEWDYHNNRNFGKPHPVFADMIRLVREKPDEVRKHLEPLRAQQAGEQHE